MPIHSIESLAHDPHLTAVNLITHEDHPTEGHTAVLRSSILADGSYLSPRTPSVPRGWDTVGILQELGFTTQESEAIQNTGAAISS
jgi:crotonobetainyl-CoA:carnitine CoA-transferase CaiB-like acyl-CoA transferase